MPVISSCGLVTGTTLHVFTASMPMKLNSFIKNFGILVGNFRSVRTVHVIYHLPNISGLSRRARLDSSYNMKLVQNSRNLKYTVKRYH